MKKQPLEVFCKKKLFLKISQISQENTCGLQLYYNETPTLVFFCEIYEIFQSTYFEEHLWTALSVDGRKDIQSLKSDWSVFHAELKAQALVPLQWNKGRKNNRVFHK